MRETEERSMRLFRRYAPGVAQGLRDEDMANVYSLVSMMHVVGAPSRMLDWSENPLVSLFFACCEMPADDGVVVCVNPAEMNAGVPSRAAGNGRQHVINASELETAVRNSDAYVLSGMRQMNVANASTRPSTLADLEGVSPVPFGVFLEPEYKGSLAASNVGMRAVLLMMSNPEATCDEWIARTPQGCRRVVIPAALKPEVLRRLDEIGVNERELFPTDEGVCLWITRRCHTLAGQP
eukprot:m51a1_g6468 hypothetical protein (237) ;mRNA; f:61999-62709